MSRAVGHLDLPTVAEVAALGGGYERAVPPEYTDANGHLNIARYMDVHSDGGWHWLERFGLGEATARAGGASTFDVEHHVRYLREVHSGDVLTLHGRLVGRSPRALHSVQFLLNRTTVELANVMEVIALSIDLTARRAVAFPPEVAAALDAQLALDRGLPWEPPLCGSMGVG